MEKSQCQQIKKEYENLKLLKKEFDLEFQKAVETGDLTRAKELKTQLETKKDVLVEKIIPREIKGTWENPETGEKKEIILNIQENLKNYKEFYKSHLNLELSKEEEKEIKRIWAKNRKEIQKEMETYGYDYLLLLPENLPDIQTLNAELIETMEEPGKGKVKETYQSDNLKEGGGLKEVKTSQAQKTRIIITKNIQNTFQSQDPIIEATLNKNIMELTGLTEEKVKKKIENKEPLTMNFKEKIKDKEIPIKAEGLSLEEYMIFQRMYFNQTNKHLDEDGWTWFLKSLSGSRVVHSSWFPDYRRLLAYAGGPGYSYDDLGGRPSRSFSD